MTTTRQPPLFILVADQDVANQVNHHLVTWLAAHGRPVDEVALGGEVTGRAQLARIDLAALDAACGQLTAQARTRRVVVICMVTTLTGMHLPAWLDDGDVHALAIVEEDLADDWHWRLPMSVLGAAADEAAWVRALDRVRSVVLGPRPRPVPAAGSTAVH